MKLIKLTAIVGALAFATATLAGKEVVNAKNSPYGCGVKY